MATNIEQIFRSFVVNKFKEIQEEEKLNSENPENSQNGDLTTQREENTSESTTVGVPSEEAAPACKEEAMKTENPQLAKPETIALETATVSKELKPAELTSDEDVKKDSSKKKSKKHKKHKSKKKKKKKKKEKHEKRSKSVSSVEDQENVNSEKTSVWKPAFSSPPKEQGLLDALSSKAENTNTVVLSLINTQESTSSTVVDKPTGLPLDMDSGFFGPKCPSELSKNISSSVTSDAVIKEHCDLLALPAQQNMNSTAHMEMTFKIAETPQSQSSLPLYTQSKSPEVNSLLDVNHENDSVHQSNKLDLSSPSKLNVDLLQKSMKKSRSKSRPLRSRSRSLVKVSKTLETSTTRSPKSRQRSYSNSRDRKKRSRSSSAGHRQRSTSRSPVRRRSRSRTRYSKSPIRSWWSKSIRNRRRSVSVKRYSSRTRSPARRQKSRSRTRSPSRQRSRSISRRYRQRSNSASNRRTRSKSAKRRYSKSGSVSRIRRSRSYSGSRRRKSRSGSAARRQRSGSASAVKRHRSRSVSPARRRRSKSASPARRRSRSASPARRRRSRSNSPIRRRRSRSTSPVRRRKSKSTSPVRRRKSRSVSPVRRRKSRSASFVKRRSRSVTPVRRRRSRSSSSARKRNSRSASFTRKRRSTSPARRRRSRSASLTRRRRSRSASPARRRRSRSASPARRRRSRSTSPARGHRSSSFSRRKSVERQQNLSSAVKRHRSRSGSYTKRPSTRTTSAARKASRSTSPPTVRKQSVDRITKSRSRSPSEVGISKLAPSNKSPILISSTVNQPTSLSGIITDELPPLNIKSLGEAERLCTEKTYMPVKLTATDSSSILSISSQNQIDSSFKASASSVSCTQFESSSQKNHYSNISDKELLTATNIFVKPSKLVNQSALGCIETNYAELQSSPGDAFNSGDSFFQSSQQGSLAEVSSVVIKKPDIVSVVDHELTNCVPEREKTCATKHKESSAVFEQTTFSQDSQPEVSTQALPIDYTSLDDSRFSYPNLAVHQLPKTALNATPAEVDHRSSDWEYLESGNSQLSKDFKKYDSVVLPSSSMVSCKEASSEYLSTVQDASGSHCEKRNTELDLDHTPLQNASYMFNAEKKTNPCPSANITNLESTLNNQCETQIGSLKEPFSQVESSGHLKLKDEPTPNLSLPSNDSVVLPNASELSHGTVFAEQSYFMLSNQTCSEQTTKNLTPIGTTKRFSAENDTDLTSAHHQADLLTSTETENCINKKQPELTDVEIPISQSHLGDKTQDVVSVSKDQSTVIFEESRRLSEPYGNRSLTDGTSSFRHLPKPVALYSSSENVESMPTASELCKSSTADSDKFKNTDIAKAQPPNLEIHSDQHCEVESIDANVSTISTDLQNLESVCNKEKQELSCEATKESSFFKQSGKIRIDTSKIFIPQEISSQEQHALSKMTPEHIEGENSQKYLSKPATANIKSIENKDHWSATFLPKELSEIPIGLNRKAEDISLKKMDRPYTSLNTAVRSFKENEIHDKLATERDSSNKFVSKVNLEDIKLVFQRPPETKISNSVESEIPRPPTAMPLQFKFSKTFRTLASSQLCNTSDESSDKETSKVNPLSLSGKATSLHVESSKTNAKSSHNVSQLKQLDTLLLTEALPPESLSTIGSDGKDALQHDAQTDSATKLTFPHLSNALTKLGVKQRQYRSRSVAQDSRSPSADRRRTSRSRSKSTSRKRRSKSKKRSQSSSRKKSAKNKRSRSKSRGRKRRSQSKSKGKKKHSPSKSSGKKKRSRSKSSERVASGKPVSGRSKSKTRRKGSRTKSPGGSRRSRSKGRKRSRSKNVDVRKTSRSKSGSSRSRSRSISASRRPLSNTKAALRRKHSRSSSKSTSPRRRSISRKSPSRSPTRRPRSRSRSHTGRHRSRSRGRWRRSLSSSRKRSRSSSRTSGTLSTKKRHSKSKSPVRGHQSRSQAKLKDKSPLTKRKSVSPIPQKKSTQSKAAAFKHSLGLKSLIQKQLSQAKSQGSGGKLSKEQIPLSAIAARAQLPASNFASRAPSLNVVPNLAEVPLPSENSIGQITVPTVPHEQQMSVTTLIPEASLPVPDLTTATPWHVPDMSSGAQWPVPDITAGTQWTMSDLTAGAQWPMADLSAGSHWPMHDLGVGTQWSVPDLAAGTPWAVPDVATGAQWTVPDLTASTQWTVPDLTAGSQWAMTNMAPGTQWSVPDLTVAAQWAVPDLTSGTHIQSADLAAEAQVPGSDLTSEAQVPGSDLGTEAQVPGSDLTAEAQVPGSDLVCEAQVPVPHHIPDTSDNLVSEGHNLMPDVTAEALVPVASGTLVPDVAAGIPLPDVTAATPTPVPDVAATINMPVPDVANNAPTFMADYDPYSSVHGSAFENKERSSVYLSLTAGDTVNAFCADEPLSTNTHHSDTPNRFEHQESVPSTDVSLPNELPSTHATVPEISASISEEEITECQIENEYCNISNPPSLLIESTSSQQSSGMSILFESSNMDCQLLPSTDASLVNNLQADTNPSLLHESCPSPMQSYISPNHASLVDPYHSPDNNLIEPYSSPAHPILVTEYSDCQLLNEPDAISDCSVLATPYDSSEHSLIGKSSSTLDHSPQVLTDQQETCPESVELHYPEQVNEYVSPRSQILVNRSSDSNIPQLVEPYRSLERPQLVEPYASPEHPQLVERYASPVCPQLVEPYASPVHPLLVEPYGSPESLELVDSEASQEFVSPEGPQNVQSGTSSLSPQLIQQYDTPDLDQPFSNPKQTQPDQPNASPKSSSTCPETHHVFQSCESLKGSLVQQCVSSDKVNVVPIANSEQPQEVQSHIVPECQQVVQSFASSDCPQLVKSCGSPEHPQLVQLYDSPERPQLVQLYDSPERPQLVQPYDSPERPQLVQPYDSPEHPELVQSYDSPKHLKPDQSYDSLEQPQLNLPFGSKKCLQLLQPCAVPVCLQLDQPHTIAEGLPQDQLLSSSNKSKQLAQPVTSPEHPQQLESPGQLVQPCAKAEHSQLVESNSSPELPQLNETDSTIAHPQLVVTYSSTYSNFDENYKQTRSPSSEPLLEVQCSKLPKEHQETPNLSQPISEECNEPSYKTTSEEPITIAHKSPIEVTPESLAHVERECFTSFDSTQLGSSTSSRHLPELGQSNNFNQPPFEKSTAGKEQLEVRHLRDDQQIEKKLSPVKDCPLPSQAQILEHTKSVGYSSSISCLNTGNLSTVQSLSVDLINVSGLPLAEEHSSSTVQLLKDTYMDFPHVDHPEIALVGTSDIPAQPSVNLLEGSTNNDPVSERNLSSFEDRVVPSVNQEEHSEKPETDIILGIAAHHLTDKSTELLACVPLDRLTPQVDSDSPLNSQQNEFPESNIYARSENTSHELNQSLQEQPLFTAKDKTPWEDSERIFLDANDSKNLQHKINDVAELSCGTNDNTSVIRSDCLSSERISDKPLSSILSGEPEEPATNLSLPAQDSFISVQISTKSVDLIKMGDYSEDNGQIDHECKIPPPDLLPFDSEQPRHLCINSESSSEPVLFISQPPPELLPYDSEQPSIHFQNISDYPSEQDSSGFHTPPELLPYDSDQTTMSISKPESFEEKLSYKPTDASESSSTTYEKPFESQVSIPSIGKETITMLISSPERPDTALVRTQELVCVEYEASKSPLLMHLSDLSSSEMLVGQPAATLLDTEFGQDRPSSQTLCDETKCELKQNLPEITTMHPLGQKEQSVEQLIEDSVYLASTCPITGMEQTSLSLNVCDPSVAQSFSVNSEFVNSPSNITSEISNKRSRSKSLSKTELSQSRSTSSKRDSPIKHKRSARSQSRSRDKKRSRSKSKTRKKRSRSKSVTRMKKSRSRSVVRTRKSRSKSATRRKKSRSVSGARFKRSRSRSKSRKRRSRSTSIVHKRSSRSPSPTHRRRSRSTRRKRSHSASVDYKRSHSQSVARRRRSRSLSVGRRKHSYSRSPGRRRKSRSLSVHHRKRSRSSSAARRRRSRSSSITRRKRSRSSSVSRRRHSPSQSGTRRRRSPSLGRRRRSRSASHRRRSRSPSVSRRRRSPSAPRRRRSRSISPIRRKRSSSARKRHSRSTSPTRKRHSRSPSPSRKRRSKSSSIPRKRHSRTPSVVNKRRSESKSPTPKSPKSKPRAQSKSERSKSRSPSNIARKRKSHSRSASRDKSKLNDKRRKRSSSKEHYSIKQRRKSRTPPRRKKSRSPVRRVSPPRSPVRRRRSRSPVRRKSFSRSPVRRKRSRSRDPLMDCARSPKRLTDLDKAQLLEIAKANAAAMCVKAGMPLPPSLKPVLTPSAPVDEKVTHRTYGVTIQELTEKCKQIAQSKEDDEVVNKPHDSDEDEEDKPFYNHPFKVSDHKPISFSLLNPSLKPTPKNQVTLTKEFPVSSGSQHRKKEDKVYGEWVPVDKKTEENKDDVFPNTVPSQPVDITAAMNERAVAQTRLTGNPFDIEALIMLNRAQEQIDVWAQSTSLPGWFSGSTGAQVLSADEISNTGPQAWYKKDQFLKAAPLTGGRGALLMRKMGWKEGDGLGRNSEGNVDPIHVDFKTDRKGLVADGEKASNKLTLPAMKDLSGKHPISVLMELCNKKKWSPPDFLLVDDTGPDHRKRFLFKVTVNGVTCQPSQPSVTKKLAKATAAAAALQALGALPKENLITTSHFCSASATAP